MNMENLKRAIEQRTGVPASLLTGETAEENIAQAKALLAYKREAEDSRQKDTQAQFAEWFAAFTGIEQPDETAKALEDIAEAARVEAGGYPRIQDGGEIDHAGMPDGRSTAEQFGEWLGRKLAFDPLKDENGWKRL